MIYLDYAATTPVAPQVAATMAGYLTQDGVYANPGSVDHRLGIAAHEAVAIARTQVAELVAAQPQEVIWTSGATEANNLAIKGVAHKLARKGRHIVTAKTEHKAVLDVCHHLAQSGFEVTYLQPNADGRLDLAAVEASLTPQTTLLTLMHVNNETGVINDLSAIGEITRRRGILFHVDGAQSAGKIAIDLTSCAVDLMSVCGHKVYGPKGIGALIVRGRARSAIAPLLHGGGQERGLRAGTLPTHQIVAMGAAFELAKAQLEADYQHLQQCKAQLWQGLTSLQQVTVNGDFIDSSPAILNVCFKAISAEALLMALPDIALATGSACNSARQQPSHVLNAMGLSTEQARGSVRFSFGRYTSEAEIATAIDQISAAVTRLRALSPLWFAQSALGRPTAVSAG